MSKLTNADITKTVEALQKAGATPNYLYASSEAIAQKFRELYPNIEVIMTPKGVMPTDTDAVVTQDKL